MSLISDALADRKEQKRVEERLKKEAVATAKAQMTFEARLYESMKTIGKIMSDNGVTKVSCEIDEKDLSSVTKAIYSGKLAEYKVTLDDKIITFEKEVIDI